MQSDNYLTKEEFIDYVYKRFDKQLPKDAIEQWTNVFIDSLKSCMMETPGVRFFKFGTFDMYRRKASVTRNFETGAIDVEVPPKNVPRFTPGRFFKEECNKGRKK